MEICVDLLVVLVVLVWWGWDVDVLLDGGVNEVVLLWLMSGWDMLLV